MDKEMQTKDFITAIRQGRSHLVSYNRQLGAFLKKYEAPKENVQEILLETQRNFAETMTRRHESERNAKPKAASITEMDGAINNLVTIAGSYYCTDGNERPVIAMQMLKVQESLKNYSGRGTRIYRGAFEIVNDTVETHMVDRRLQTDSLCKLVHGSRKNWSAHSALAEYVGSDDVKEAIGENNVAKVVNAFIEEVDTGDGFIGLAAQGSALSRFREAKTIFKPEQMPALNEKLVGCDETLAALGYGSNLNVEEHGKRRELISIRTSLLSIGGYGLR